MQNRTSVSAALRQAQELIEHAERNNEVPDRVWLAQLGRAYASSVRAEMSDALRYFSTLEERRGTACDELIRTINSIEMRLDGTDAPPETSDSEDPVADSFTPDEHRQFIARIMDRERSGE